MANPLNAPNAAPDRLAVISYLNTLDDSKYQKTVGKYNIKEAASLDVSRQWVVENFDSFLALLPERKVGLLDLNNEISLKPEMTVEEMRNALIRYMFGDIRFQIDRADKERWKSYHTNVQNQFAEALKLCEAKVKAQAEPNAELDAEVTKLKELYANLPLAAKVAKIYLKNTEKFALALSELVAGKDALKETIMSMGEALFPEELVSEKRVSQLKSAKPELKELHSSKFIAALSNYINGSAKGEINDAKAEEIKAFLEDLVTYADVLNRVSSQGLTEEQTKAELEKAKAELSMHKSTLPHILEPLAANQVELAKLNKLLDDEAARVKQEEEAAAAKKAAEAPNQAEVDESSEPSSSSSSSSPIMSCVDVVYDLKDKLSNVLGAKPKPYGHFAGLIPTRNNLEDSIRKLEKQVEDIEKKILEKEFMIFALNDGNAVANAQGILEPVFTKVQVEEIKTLAKNHLLLIEFATAFMQQYVGPKVARQKTMQSYWGWN